MTRVSSVLIKNLLKTTGQIIDVEAVKPEETPSGTEVEYNLPIPPTTNHLFITRGRFRVISPKYKLWRVKAGDVLTDQSPINIIGQVHLVVSIYGGKGFPVIRDLDNCNKAVIDLLVTHKVIEEDDVRRVLSVLVRYIPPDNKKTEARCTITIRRA